MSVLVDYRCSSCGGLEERWAPSPPPPSAKCRSCGAPSRRAWAPIGLSGPVGRSQPPPADTAGASKAAGPSLASRYPQLPGLCHMSESAGRMWVAKYTADGRAVEREQERQELRQRDHAPTLEDLSAHEHSAPASAQRAVQPPSAT